MEMSLGAQLSPGREPLPAAAAAMPTPPEEDEVAEMHHVAQKAYAEGRHKDALNSLLKAKAAAAAASPEDDEGTPPGLLTNLVTVRRAMGDLDVAATMAELEAIYRKARECGDFEHADHGPLIFNLALMYFLHRRYLQAEALLRPVSQHVPVCGEWHINRRSFAALPSFSDVVAARRALVARIAFSVAAKAAGRGAPLQARPPAARRPRERTPHAGLGHQVHGRDGEGRARQE